MFQYQAPFCPDSPVMHSRVCSADNNPSNQHIHHTHTHQANIKRDHNTHCFHPQKSETSDQRVREVLISSRVRTYLHKEASVTVLIKKSCLEPLRFKDNVTQRLLNSPSSKHLKICSGFRLLLWWLTKHWTGLFPHRMKTCGYNFGRT